MADPHLDHPGEVTWFPGKTPRTVLGDCPHTRCPHDQARCVAWGPDLQHYTLDECTVPADSGGCAGQCRAWASETPHPRGGVIYGWGPWLFSGSLTSGPETGNPPASPLLGRTSHWHDPDVVDAAYATATAGDPGSYEDGVRRGIDAVMAELDHRGIQLFYPAHRPA